MLIPPFCLHGKVVVKERHFHKHFSFHCIIGNANAYSPGVAELNVAVQGLNIQNKLLSTNEKPNPFCIAADGWNGHGRQ